MKKLIALFLVMSSFIYAEEAFGFVTHFNTYQFEETGVKGAEMLIGVQFCSFPDPGQTGWMSEVSAAVPIYVVINGEKSDSGVFLTDLILGYGKTHIVPVKNGENTYFSVGFGLHAGNELYFESTGVAQQVNFGPGMMILIGGSSSQMGISFKLFADLFGSNTYYFKEGSATQYELNKKMGFSVGILYRF